MELTALTDEELTRPQGATVTHDGNVWSPDAHPAGWKKI